MLGLRGSRTALLGEARWQADALDLRALHELQKKVPLVPRAVTDPRFALWSRGGVTREVKRAGAEGYALREMLAR